jgi:hypothetical protein
MLPALAKSQNGNQFEEFDDEDKVMAPSNLALGNGQLFPCPVCERTFAQKTLDKHIIICEKVRTKKKGEVFDMSKKRLEGLESVPRSTFTSSSSKMSLKKKPLKPEDEFQLCPTCSRKFGHKVLLKY